MYYLRLGQKWEMRISEWLQENNVFVLDAFKCLETESSIKSPRYKLLPQDQNIIIPDLLLAKNGISQWVEVKYKNNGLVNYKDSKTYSGFDSDKLLHYIRVQSITGIPVYVFFLHKDEMTVRASSLNKLLMNSTFTFTKIKDKVLWDLETITQVAQLFNSDSTLKVGPMIAKYDC
jgi:hypothetical protein